MAGVLNGLRVLDLSDGFAGQFAARLLGDFGADVILVEPPQGTATRRLPPFRADEVGLENSGTFLLLNANKRGITLNLATDSGRDLFSQMVKQSDVLIEDRPLGELTGSALEYEKLVHHNPRLIVLHVSPFGRIGPYSTYQANHFIVCALGGWISRAGEPDREPLTSGTAIAHYVGGTVGASAVVAALLQQRSTGSGQFIDLSEMQCLVHLGGMGGVPIDALKAEGDQAPDAYLSATPRTRTGSSYFPAYIIVPCRDGHVAWIVLSEAQWQSLVGCLNMPELLEDPRYDTPIKRNQHRMEILEYVKPWFRERTQKEVVAALQEWRVPVAPIPTMDKVFESEQLRSRGWFATLHHPVIGSITFPGPPFRMQESPWELRSPAPTLGQHNREVYGGWLGLEESRVRRLYERGII